MFEPSSVSTSLGLFAALVAPCVLRGFDIGQMTDRALERAGITHKQAADFMSAPDSPYSETQLSRQLRGRGPEHLSGDRLSRLPERFWAAFALEVGEFFRWVDGAESRDRRVVQRVVSRHADHVHAEETASAA